MGKMPSSVTVRFCSGLRAAPRAAFHRHIQRAGKHGAFRPSGGEAPSMNI
jgi:hypothetical protein